MFKFITDFVLKSILSNSLYEIELISPCKEVMSSCQSIFAFVA